MATVRLAVCTRDTSSALVRFVFHRGGVLLRERDSIGSRKERKQFDLQTRGDSKDSTLIKCVGAVYLIISPLSSGCPTSSRAAVLQNTFDISTFGTLSDTRTRRVVSQLSGSMTAREHSETNHFRQRRETSRSVFLVESRACWGSQLILVLKLTTGTDACFTHQENRAANGEEVWCGWTDVTCTFLKQLSVLNTYFERSAFHVILSNLSGVVNTSSNQFHNSWHCTCLWAIKVTFAA